MPTSLILAFVVAAGLLVMVAVGRRRVAPSWQRNALSVAMVVLGLGVAFIFCFGGGFLVQKLRAQAEVHGDARPPSRTALLAAAASSSRLSEA